MTRRASAMSDEISKQSKAKFEAITPTSVSALRNNSQVTEVKEKTLPLARTDQLRETGGSFTLRKEVLETKFRVEQFIRENTPLMEKQRQTLADVEKLRTEVSSLRERLGVDAQEIQKLKASLAEQGVKLHSQRRDIEDQKTLLEKARDEVEVGKLRAEVNVLQERLLTTHLELQKLKANLDEQNLKRQHVLDSEAQRAPAVKLAPVVKAASGPEIASPMPYASETIYPETQLPLDSTLKRCVNCGFLLQPQDNYCMHCGQIGRAHV
jgi:chromosome segregation ATPase